MEKKIKEEARRLGFTACGIARAEPLEELRRLYEDCIREKNHVPFKFLEYFERYAEKRLNPGLLVHEAKSIIALLINYYPSGPIPGEDNFILSKYAYGKDYHPVIKTKMDQLTGYLKSLSETCTARSFVDSGPVLEKVWAQRSGVGWQGKNTLLINPAAGSFCFIGVIITSLDLQTDPPVTDRCGSCDRCIRACPTGALEKPYQLNISRCIASLTIEGKTEIPAEFKGKFNDRIYGCDICQDVCPYNRFAKPHEEPAFLPSEALKKMRKKDWLALTEIEFQTLFAGSAVARLGYQRLMRNIRFVI